MIAAYRQGIEVAEPGSPMWFDLSNNLGVALQERSERRGDPVDAVADLDDAIRIVDSTVPLLRDNPAELGIHLGGRGNAWRRRHRHDHAADSIERAVGDYRAAAAAAPSATDRGTHRLSLANALIDRFHLLGELPDLDEAIEAYQSAVTLLPQHDERRAGLLTSLANAYSDRWDSAGRREDLDAALETQEQAVALTGRGSDDWPGHLSNLGNRYLARFDAAGDIADIDAAIRQWAVLDEPTAMLMTEFARRWAGGRITPAAALGGAQRWLRDSTNAEKIAHWQQADLPHDVRDAFTGALAWREPDARQHADLHSWAAFSTVGA